MRSISENAFLRLAAELKGRRRYMIIGGNQMEHGTVKWFSVRKGFGFLTGEDEEDHFVHYSNIIMDGFKTLKAGQEVTFQLMKVDENRSQAVDVKPVD